MAVTSGRYFRMAVGVAAAGSPVPPVDGVTEPHIRLSPRTAWGTPTTGFLVGIKAPGAGTNFLAANILAGGAELTVYIRNPVTRQWFAFETLSGIVLGGVYPTYDCGPCELFFAFSNVALVVGDPDEPGYLDVTVMEQ